MHENTNQDLNEEEPSLWIRRFVPRIVEGGRVLDVACGAGRHALLLARLGYRVEAADRNATALARLSGIHGIRTTTADLESEPWPYAGQLFDGVIVSRYLHRPLLPLLPEVLRPQGVLIYETFMEGNERFGRPSNPDFLLKRDELLDAFSGRLQVVAFEQGVVNRPQPAVIQRICAVRV
ncbi:ubiquinone/menaquinone biosynthesis C-methyltransferase UbiE [Novimethylophilus kurashikiensis]|uniref:Ubiquinone/menaquinone biosynthesis C-methyltransferase UbiE n=1 Tax=Novimethylophilus kurashikiensis TaxID=1825523 RepID=A0A2R5FCB7_9PROT|nr:methyltransferase domain-containing protein [Novimethylophilus kurashikiensis]GBG15840.1 ubiquinone/menaquinone biosynthesis C-methyltransferase UbiE [Novimethylophilus kurashikiensis]